MSLPDYTVRESARAKLVRFRVGVSDGLVVVIPKGFDRRTVPELVERHRAWIDRALRQMEAHREGLPPPEERPSVVALPGIGETWRLDWLETADERACVTAVEPSRLRVSGSIGDRSAWAPALRRWLIERGREQLIPWAERLAGALDVRIQRVSIRCQRTRWGSYSARRGGAGAIHLNAQLLFLPKQLVRYVLVHELCHAVCPDHSPRFWELVRSYEPDVDRLRAELRAAWRRIPAWAHTP